MEVCMYFRSDEPRNCYTISGNRPLASFLKIHRLEDNHRLYVPVGSDFFLVSQTAPIVLEKVFLKETTFAFDGALCVRGAISDAVHGKYPQMLRSFHQRCEYSIVLCQLNIGKAMRGEEKIDTEFTGVLLATCVKRNGSDVLVTVPFDQKEPLVIFLSDGSVRMFLHKDKELAEMPVSRKQVFSLRSIFALAQFKRTTSRDVRRRVCDSMFALRGRAVNKERKSGEFSNAIDRIFFEDEDVARYLREKI